MQCAEIARILPLNLLNKYIFSSLVFSYYIYIRMCCSLYTPSISFQNDYWLEPTQLSLFESEVLSKTQQKIRTNYVMDKFIGHWKWLREQAPVTNQWVEWTLKIRPMKRIQMKKSEPGEMFVWYNIINYHIICQLKVRDEHGEKKKRPIHRFLNKEILWT